jgi:hypothetical protein
LIYNPNNQLNKLYMKIQFEKNPEQIELIKALASENKTGAMQAQEAFAAFISDVVLQVLLQAGTASMIYRDVEFDEDDTPSIPLDLYYGQGEGTISVWSQTVGGGLPSSLQQGLQEMKVNTYRLDSAISMEKRYVRRARLDVVAAGLERMANELLVKQERNAWAVILKGLAEAATQSTSGGQTQNHVIRTSSTDGSFDIDGLNKLWTLVRRINAAYTGGTPLNLQARGLTDLFVSPEVKEQIRGFAYQPMNTKGANSVVGTNTSGVLGLPDAVREEIYRGSGTQEIFGVTIHEMLELGIGRKYQTLFGAFAAGKSYAKGDGSSSSSFTLGSDELIVGIDSTRNAFLRPVAIQSESRGQVKVLPDDQFLARSQKVGFYSYVEDGRVLTDARAIVGLLI